MTATSIGGGDVGLGKTALRMLPGLVIGLGFFLGAMVAQGGHMRSIQQLTAFIFVLGGVGAAAMMGFPLAGTSRTRILQLEACAKAVIFAGVIGTVFGLIHVMENLDKQDEIGPGIAVALVCLLYSLGVWAICKALMHRLVTTLQARSTGLVHPLETYELPMISFASVFILMFTVFMVLYALTIAFRHTVPSPNHQAPAGDERGERHGATEAEHGEAKKEG